MGKHSENATVVHAEGANPRNAVLFDVIVCGVAVGAAVGSCALIWSQGGGNLEQALLNAIGCVGVVISLVGVLLAYLIFRRQNRAARSADLHQREVLGELRQALWSVDEKVSNLSIRQASDSVSDEDANEGSEEPVDLWAAFTPEEDQSEVYLTSPSGKRRRVFLPSAIPLAVVGALVRKWTEDGLTGRWTLGELRGAFRAEGKGNHPWYLVFVPPNDDNPIVWKVTRGPGGTDHAVQVRDNKDFR